MTKKNLFRIILKIAGLYLIYSVLFNAILSYVMFIGKDSFSITTLLFMVLTTVIFMVLFLSLIFKPDIYINLFKFDKNFDDDNVMIKRATFENLLQVSIIVVGLVFIVKHLPLYVTKLMMLLNL